MMKFLNLIRLREFQSFTREFFLIVSKIRSVLVVLIVLIAIGGWVLARVESLEFWDGQYLAFVTALTIGYGDLFPSAPLGKIICIALGLIGMIWVGLIVGIASVAVRRAVGSEHGGAKSQDGQNRKKIERNEDHHELAKTL
jgi:voltage-gated potassium channel